MAAIWNYNGSDTLTVSLTGLEPAVTFDLFANDPMSSGDIDTSSGIGSLVLSTNDIGGASSGHTFYAEVFHDTGDENPVACIIFKIGTSGSSDQGIPTVWTYDGGGGGTGVVTCSFTSEIGIEYKLEVNDDFGGIVSVMGDGNPQTLTYSTLDYGTASSFHADLFQSASPVWNYAHTLFVSGVASSGSRDLTTSTVVDGRVMIAFDFDNTEGPLEPDPVWTTLDQGGDFPDQFVAGYDTKNGRRGLLDQTETGTATVYVNDRSGLFDDRNLSSPYTGHLSGKQIKLQLWNPVTEVWEPQFRGWIDDWGFDIDGSSVDANGDPINASLRIDCVDVFDFLNLYGLTPGLDGHVPPAGMEDGVWYDTAPIQDRFIKILDDVGIDPSRYHLARGNVNVIGVKYDPDESALTALRDAADAEIPFICNIYVDRYGRFVFRGRYSRFDPDFVSSEPGSDWDFQRWPLGDGKAIQDDPTRGQIRLLEYLRSKANVINAAIAYPQGIDAADMPNQVYASTLSITAHGKHQAAPMSDLLTCEPTSSGYDKYVETAKFAELLVENKKAPHFEITALQLKSMPPDDPRAEATWGAICGADIDHIVNVAAGYPGGTGLDGDSVNDDHYIEGRALTVRPLNPVHDYVECDLDVSPAVWSMDTHGVFPPAGNPT